MWWLTVERESRLTQRVFTWAAGLLMMLFSEPIERWIQIFVCWICAVLCLVAQSCLTLCDSLNCSLPGSSVHWDSPGKYTGMGCHALQGIFPTQGSNPGLLHCRQILYHWATREVHVEYKFNFKCRVGCWILRSKNQGDIPQQEYRFGELSAYRQYSKHGSRWVLRIMCQVRREEGLGHILKVYHYLRIDNLRRLSWRNQRSRFLQNQKANEQNASRMRECWLRQIYLRANDGKVPTEFCNKGSVHWWVQFQWSMGRGRLIIVIERVIHKKLAFCFFSIDPTSWFFYLSSSLPCPVSPGFYCTLILVAPIEHSASFTFKAPFYWW